MHALFKMLGTRTEAIKIFKLVAWNMTVIVTRTEKTQHALCNISKIATISNLRFPQFKYAAGCLVLASINIPVVIGVSLSEPHINVKFVRLVCLSVRS